MANVTMPNSVDGKRKYIDTSNVFSDKYQHMHVYNCVSYNEQNKESDGYHELLSDYLDSCNSLSIYQYGLYMLHHGTTPHLSTIILNT